MINTVLMSVPSGGSDATSFGGGNVPAGVVMMVSIGGGSAFFNKINSQLLITFALNLLLLIINNIYKNLFKLNICGSDFFC